jgi:hypothetical protein
MCRLKTARLFVNAKRLLSFETSKMNLVVSNSREWPNCFWFVAPNESVSEEVALSGTSTLIRFVSIHVLGYHQV